MRFLHSAQAATLIVLFGAANLLPAQDKQDKKEQPQQQEAAGQPAGPKAKTQKELEALQKVQAAAQAQNYDGEILAINGVLESFTDTEFKPMLLNMGMDAAQRKGDQALLQDFGERALKADPNNVQARVVLGANIASHVRENDLDKETNLKKAEEYENKALELLKGSPQPPPGFPPDQWPTFQKELNAQAYDTLGLIADTRKNYPDAIKQYQAALSAQPNFSVSMARLAKAYIGNKQYDEAIATADKVAAISEAPASVKQFAATQKENATKLKGAAAAPAAKPATPPVK